MNRVRMPASDVLPFAGNDIASGTGFSNQRNNTRLQHNSQLSHKGNRCGHDKNKFRFPAFPKENKRRYHVIEESKRLIGQLLRNPCQFDGISNIFYNHGLAKPRKRRSESLEAILSLTISALIHDCCLQNMQYGQYIYNNNTFRNYGYDRLLQHTGLSSSRLKRAMSVLKSLGLVTVQKILYDRHEPNDPYRTEKVIITISDELFRAFNLYNEFLTDRERACIKYHDREIKLDRSRKRKELYRPKPLKAKMIKPKKDIQDLTNHLTNLERKSETRPYNPAQDRQVIFKATDILKSGYAKDMKEAIAAACKLLGRPPPH